jgi:hypothetical protein
VIAHHPQIRFSVLKEWTSKNMLAILRRASSDWKTTADLTSVIPAYLEPEAEIIDGRMLLIGTRGHEEKVAIPIRDVDPASGLSEFFDFFTNGRTAANNPAVMMRRNGRLSLVTKGTVSRTSWQAAAAEQRLRQSQTLNAKTAYETMYQTECIIVAGDAAPVSQHVFRQYVQEFFQTAAGTAVSPSLSKSVTKTLTH